MLRRIALTASVVFTVSTALAGDAGRGSGRDPGSHRPVAVNPSVTIPAEGQTCTALHQAMGAIELVGGRNFQFLDGDAARSGAALFNETPPVSRGDWSLVALVDGPDGTGSLLVGKGAQVCGRVSFTSELWPRLVERLLGRRA